MTAECEQLRSEIQRLRQEIQTLDGKFIPASERAAIYSGIATATASAALANSAAAAAGAAASSASAIASAALAGFQVVLNQLRAYVRREELKAIKNRLSVIEAFQDTLVRLIELVKNQADRNKSELARLDAFTQQLNAKLNSFIAQLAGISQSLRDLLNSVSEIKSTLRSHANRIAFLEQKLEAINQSLLEALRLAREALQKASDALQKAKENGRQILILQGLVAALSAGLAALTATVSGLSAAVAVLGKTVASLVTAVARNTAAIARLLGQLGQIRLRLRFIEIGLDQIETLANQARQLALNALDKAGFAIDFAKSLSLGGNVNQADSALLRKLLSLALRNNAAIAQASQLAGLAVQKLGGSITGSVDVSPCESDSPELIPYSGQGLVGVYSALRGLATLNQRSYDSVKCGTNGTAALPMYFEVRPGEIPQLNVQWGPASGGSSRWSMTIPHPKNGLSTLPVNFPTYWKGNTQISYRLSDNSKVILNARSRNDGLPVLNYIRTLINPSFIDPSALPVINDNAGQGRVKVVQVRARYMQFFQGHRDTIADWDRRL
ncbi:MAG: hypothetical protein AAFS06_05200 [Cyanobacteria bacterium J06631_12]